MRKVQETPCYAREGLSLFRRGRKRGITRLGQGPQETEFVQNKKQKAVQEASDGIDTGGVICSLWRRGGGNVFSDSNSIILWGLACLCGAGIAWGGMRYYVELSL